jgi:adenylosuccinate lyase
MDTWDGGVPFIQTLRKRAQESGIELDDAGLDAAMRPERYVERLGPVFDRVAALS